MNSKSNSEKNLAIIGASYLQMPLIKKAKEKGYITHVFAWEAGDPGEEEADYFYPISIVEKDEILEKCRQIGIAGICTVSSDLAAITVNYVANALGLPCNSPKAALISTNKHEMRKTFKEKNIPSCKSVQISSAEEFDLSQIALPIIVKPVDRSGSRGIFKVDSPERFAPAVEVALAESFEKHVLVEEYAHGQEYSAECISQNGIHHFLALTEKTTTGAPHFIEKKHSEPANVSDEMYEKIKQTVFSVLNALELTTGASHTEFKIDREGNIRIIEAAGRMGGDAIGTHLVYYSTGYDFTEMVIDCAVGQPIHLHPKFEGFPVESRFIFTQEDLDIYYQMKNNEPERFLDVLDLHPEKVGTATDSSSRSGCYVIRT